MERDEPLTPTEIALRKRHRLKTLLGALLLMGFGTFLVWRC
jgi:hypothetical protein